MKKLLLFIGLLWSLGCHAQLNYTAKAYRSILADSTTVRAEIVGLQLMYDSVGAMYYNRQSSPGKWRCYTTDAGWFDCFGAGGGGGGGGITTADNGLSLSSATNVVLGGPIGDPSELLSDRYIDATVGAFSIIIDQSLGGTLRLEGAGSDGLSLDPDQIGASNNLSIISSDDMLIGLASSNSVLIFDVPSDNVTFTIGNTGNFTVDTNSTGSGDVVFDVGDDFSVTIIDDGLITAPNGTLTYTADDINIDATNTSLTLNGQTSVNIGSTPGAGIITLASGTGGITLNSSGNIDIEVTGTADYTIDVDAPATRYMIIEGLPTSSAGLPVGALYDSATFIKIKH